MCTIYQNIDKLAFITITTSQSADLTIELKIFILYYKIV